LKRSEDIKKSMVVDDDDRHLLEKHIVHASTQMGYPAVTIDGKNVYFHHLILPKKKGFVVDHINRNVLDARKSNLRYCSPSENIRNSKLSKTNKSGYKGIRMHEGTGKWIVQVRFEGKTRHVGLFKSIEDAIQARLEVAKALFGEYLSEQDIC
jgi:hypothetical protein